MNAAQQQPSNSSFGSTLFACVFLACGGMAALGSLASNPPSADEVLDGTALDRAIKAAKDDTYRRFHPEEARQAAQERALNALGARRYGILESNENAWGTGSALSPSDLCKAVARSLSEVRPAQQRLNSLRPDNIEAGNFEK